MSNFTFGGDKPFRKPWERGGASGSRPRSDRGGGFRSDRDDRPRYDRDDRPRFNRDDRPRFGSNKPSFGGKPSFRKPWERDDAAGGAPRRPPRPPRTAPIPAEGELVFGRQPVREILRAARRPVSLVVLADGVKDGPEVAEIKALAEERGAKIEFFRREDIEAWVNGANHQGVVAFCEEYPYAELDEIADALAAAEGPATVVVLDYVQDPQNLGSILRTCECAGVLGVVLPVDRAASVTPAAVRASAGAAEHMKIARISNLVVALERFKAAGAWITGLEAVEGAKPCTAVDFKGKACIVVGSESHGLCSPVRKACDFLARLPLRGRVNSLNAGVAVGLAVYEALRQQGAYDDPANFPAVEPAPAAESEPEPEPAPAVESEPAPAAESGPAPESAPTDEAVPAEPDETPAE